MGFLFDFITGGPTKAISKKIAKRHFLLKEDYSQTWFYSIAEMIQTGLNGRRYTQVDEAQILISDAVINNYVKLIALELYITAPVSALPYYDDVLSDQYFKIQRILLDNNIPEVYISGENEEQTMDFTSKLKADLLFENLYP